MTNGVMTPGVEVTGWHGGAAAVVTLTFDVDAETPVLAHGRGYAEHLSTMSHQAYGPEVGVPRILDLLAELDVPATFFVPGWVAQQRPGLAASIVERGHEVAHHSYSHRAPTSLTPAEERADFERALAVFAVQGIEISGHRVALWEASPLTPELVAEHGLLYDSSLMADDRPYRIAVGGREIAELPVHWSLDDWEQYAFLPAPQIGSVINPPSAVLDHPLPRPRRRGPGRPGAARPRAAHARGRPGGLPGLSRVDRASAARRRRPRAQGTGRPGPRSAPRLGR